MVQVSVDLSPTPSKKKQSSWKKLTLSWVFFFWHHDLHQDCCWVGRWNRTGLRKLGTNMKGMEIIHQASRIIGCTLTNVPLLCQKKALNNCGLAPTIPREHNKYHGYLVRGTFVLVPWRNMKVSLVRIKNLSSKHHLFRCSNTSEVGWLTRWWFQIFFIFTPIWGRFPFWLIFFKWVETTTSLTPKSSTLSTCRTVFLRLEISSFSTKFPLHFSDSKICRRYFLLEQHGVKCLCNRCAANFGMGGDASQSKQNLWRPKFGWCFFADMEAKCWCLLKQYQSSKNSLDLSWKFERASSKGICEIKIVIGAWTPILPESWFSAKSP